MPPGTRSPIRVRESPMPIRCPAPSRRQAQRSTARSGRWSRKIPASSRATWGNEALRRLWATETAVSRTGGRNASWNPGETRQRRSRRRSRPMRISTIGKPWRRTPSLHPIPSPACGRNGSCKSNMRRHTGRRARLPRPGKQRRSRQRRPRKPLRSPSAPPFS